MNYCVHFRGSHAHQLFIASVKGTVLSTYKAFGKHIPVFLAHKTSDIKLIVKKDTQPPNSLK